MKRMLQLKINAGIIREHIFIRNWYMLQLYPPKETLKAYGYAAPKGVHSDIE